MNDELVNYSFAFNHLRWNRLLLRLFWFALLVTVVVEWFYLKMTNSVSWGSVCLWILRPSALLIAVILLAEAGVRWSSKHHDYILISSATLMAVIISTIHATETYLLLSLFFPVMVGLFYFQLTALIYAMLNTAISFLSVCLFSEDTRQSLTLGSLAGFVGLLVVFGLAALGALLKSAELRKHLYASCEAQQELLLHRLMTEQLPRIDTLTGIGSHTAFHECLDRLVRQADSRTVQLQLALLDIDGFKSLNDTFGHRAGDDILRDVAGALAFKSGTNDFAARYGGEEFAMLFADRTLQEVYDRLEEIRLLVADSPRETVRNVPVTLSVGLAAYTPGLGKEALLRKADAALHEAKRQGKNRTVIASAIRKT